MRQTRTSSASPTLRAAARPSAGLAGSRRAPPGGRGRGAERYAGVGAGRAARPAGCRDPGEPRGERRGARGGRGAGLTARARLGLARAHAPPGGERRAGGRARSGGGCSGPGRAGPPRGREEGRARGGRGGDRAAFRVGGERGGGALTSGSEAAAAGTACWGVRGSFRGAAAPRPRPGPSPRTARAPRPEPLLPGVCESSSAPFSERCGPPAPRLRRPGPPPASPCVPSGGLRSPTRSTMGGQRKANPERASHQAGSEDLAPGLKKALTHWGDRRAAPGGPTLGRWTGSLCSKMPLVGLTAQ